MENSRTPEDVERVLHNLLQWLQSPALKLLERNFTLWLERVLLLARLPGIEIPMVTNLREMNSMLAEGVVEWIREWKRQGIQEGLQKGVQKGVHLGEASLLKRLLVKRFGPLTPAIESRLAEAATEQLDEWAERVLDAKSLDEVFQD